MPNPTPNTIGLTPFTAPDTTGGTVPLAAKISPNDRDWLDNLPEGRSYHVRQSIRVYRELKEGNLSSGQPRTQQLSDLDAIAKLVLEDAKTWVNIPSYHAARSSLALFVHYLKQHSAQ